MNKLFTPVQVGRYTLPNRLIMAPMTRSRADDAGVPSDLVATYYAQRANAGLIISEGVFPSALGKGYVRSPGIVTKAQVEAWKKVALNVPDRTTFYTPGAAGYIDYPTLNSGMSA